MNQNLGADRAIGGLWEKRFRELAREHGRGALMHQEHRDGAAIATDEHGAKIVLPDITLMHHGEEHHEIKHKSPTRDGCFGVEEYRLKSWLQFAEATGRPVYYTIHDHQKAGGRDVDVNRIEDWVTADVKVLGKTIHRKAWGQSWIDGVKKDTVICYWKVESFMPLDKLWELDEENKE